MVILPPVFKYTVDYFIKFYNSTVPTFTKNSQLYTSRVRIMADIIPKSPRRNVATGSGSPWSLEEEEVLVHGRESTNCPMTFQDIHERCSPRSQPACNKHYNDICARDLRPEQLKQLQELWMR